MNWEAFGAIGEIVGAIAVVASLIYLASQMRISNRESQQAAMREVSQSGLTFLGRIGSDVATASVWLRGLTQNEALTAEESMQFTALCTELTDIWERAHYLRKLSEFEPHLIQSMESNLHRIAGSPGFRSWFKGRSSSYSDEFVQMVQVCINDSDNYEPWRATNKD